MSDRPNNNHRLAGLVGVLALTVGMTLAGAGTAAAAGNSVLIYAGHGHGLGVDVDVTYTCTGAAGFSGFVTGTGVAAGTSGVTPICDGNQRTAEVGFNCILPNNNCSFLTGDVENATVYLGQASDSRTIQLT